MPDIQGPWKNDGSAYPNTPEIDPEMGDPEADCNKGGMGNITREVHQTIPPGDVDRAARQAQAESDAAFRALQRQVGSDSTSPKK